MNPVFSIYTKYFIVPKPNKKNTQPMRKSACIKIFCASAAVIVPLTVGLLMKGDYRHGFVMIFLLIMASGGLLKAVK